MKHRKDTIEVLTIDESIKKAKKEPGKKRWLVMSGLFSLVLFSAMIAVICFGLSSRGQEDDSIFYTNEEDWTIEESTPEETQEVEQEEVEPEEVEPEEVEPEEVEPEEVEPEEAEPEEAEPEEAEPEVVEPAVQEEVVAVTPTIPSTATVGKIALTFDDGVGADTARLLATLEAYGAHATFFVLGCNLEDSEASILQKMVAIGCEIGNHSMSHANFTELTTEQIKAEVDTTNARIQALAGVTPTLVRVPYGAFNDTVLQAVGYPVIQWSVDTRDWATTSSNVVLAEILNGASAGNVILLHDVKSWSVDAAIEAIPILVNAGYELVTVSELAASTGVALQAGTKYNSFK